MLFRSQLKKFKVFINKKHPKLFEKLNEEDNETNWLIFMLIEIDGELSLQNIGDILNITRRIIDHKVRSYRNLGYIIRKGSTKSGVWLINDM